MGNAQHRRFSPKSLPFTHCSTCKYTHNFRGKLCCLPLLVGKLRKTFGLWRQQTNEFCSESNDRLGEKSWFLRFVYIFYPSI